MNNGYRCHFCGRVLADRVAGELHESACKKGLRKLRLDIDSGNVSFERIGRNEGVPMRISIGICSGIVDMVYDPEQCQDSEAVKTLVAEVLKRHKKKMAEVKERISFCSRELKRLSKSTKVLKCKIANMNADVPGDDVSVLLSVASGKGVEK